MVSIILPTYNEADNIVPLIQSIEKEVNQPLEIIVVDDDSPDKTWQKVEEYIATSKKKTIHLERRMSDHGLTKSIQHGINTAKGDIIVWMDCDFSHPPEVIPRLIEQIEQGYDIAVASRFVQGGAQKRIRSDLRRSRSDPSSPKVASESQSAIILSTILNKSMNILFQMKFYDFTSGFVAIKSDVIKTIPLRGDYGEYFIDLIVRAYRKKYTMIEVPFVPVSRRAGQSKTAPNMKILLKRAKQYGWTVVQLVFP